MVGGTEHPILRLIEELQRAKERAIQELLAERAERSVLLEKRREIDKKLGLLGCAVKDRGTIRAVRVCGICQQTGHNARTCPNKKKAIKGS